MQFKFNDIEITSSSFGVQPLAWKCNYMIYKIYRQGLHQSQIRSVFFLPTVPQDMQ